MRKNAFTLVELLAVIIILGVLATLITPNLMNLFDDKQNILYDNTIEEIKNVARLYASDNPEVYNKIDNAGFTYVYINTLCEEKYITCPINNPKDNSNIKGAIKITYENETFNYEYVEDAPYKFETDSWPTIIAAVQSGVSPYKVGDTKQVELKNNLGTHTLRIANTSSCSKYTLSSQTACGFVLEFADIITTYNMNSTSTNEGGWPASAMRSYLNVTETEGSGTIYNALPKELKSAIIDTTVVSGHGSGDTTGTLANNNFESTDKLYLLSSEEVYAGLSSGDTLIGTSRQLDYYSSKSVTTENNENRENAIKKLNGEVKYWWLRSACSGSSASFFGVNYNGSWYGANATDGNGVSPAFRLAS